VGLNTPFVSLDARANIVEGNALSTRFQSVVDSPIVFGIRQYQEGTYIFHLLEFT